MGGVFFCNGETSAMTEGRHTDSEHMCFQREGLRVQAMIPTVAILANPVDGK